MNNLKEKLEISKWLHEQGFEPDRWLANSSDDDFCLNTEKAEWDDAWFIHPYFTLNRVLELLPDDIYEGWSYRLELYKLNDRFVITYFNDWSKGHLLKEENKDTELAALRLLKKVVEVGYLSNNSNGSKVVNDE